MHKVPKKVEKHLYGNKFMRIEDAIFDFLKRNKGPASALVKKMHIKRKLRK